MLLEDVKQTHENQTAGTFRWVKEWEENKEIARDKEIGRMYKENPNLIHPYVQRMISGTCGNLYAPLIGKLKHYPIPELCLHASEGDMFLDVGCNWGRWSIAAAQKGYKSVGIDPLLPSILAARRIAISMGLDNKYIVADGRFLPFRDDFFYAAYSYSVLQHFSKENAKISIRDMARVVKSKGVVKIQLPNMMGIRNIYNWSHRGFTKGKDFDVRYWTLREIKQTFQESVGATELSVDGFFGLGIQKSDIEILPWYFQMVVRLSEVLRKLCKFFPWLMLFADSIYAEAEK